MRLKAAAFWLLRLGGAIGENIINGSVWILRMGNVRAKLRYCLGVLVFLFASAAAAQGHDVYDVPIMGAPVATKEQCVNYLLSVNPAPKIMVSPEELVKNYYEEAAKEGVRPDIAFAQALQETGFFRYGGSVHETQNNYCGLGSTSSYENGARFENSRLGVRAHIQHLLAYSSTKMPNEEIVDPRYHLVMTTQNYGRARTWEDLNGRWAIPGYGYGRKILNIYYEMLSY